MGVIAWWEVRPGDSSNIWPPGLAPGGNDGGFPGTGVGTGAGGTGKAAKREGVAWLEPRKRKWEQREEEWKEQGAKRRGCHLASPPGAPCTLSTPSTSEGQEGRSGVAPGLISPLESRSKKQSCLVKDIRRKLGTLVGGARGAWADGIPSCSSPAFGHSPGGAFDF